VARFFGPPCIDSSVATVAISRDERRDTLLAVNHTVNYFDKHRQRQNRKTAKRISFRRFIACLQANRLSVAEIRTRSIRRLTFLAPCAALHCVARPTRCKCGFRHKSSTSTHIARIFILASWSVNGIHSDINIQSSQ